MWESLRLRKSPGLWESLGLWKPLGSWKSLALWKSPGWKVLTTFHQAGRNAHQWIRLAWQVLRAHVEVKLE